MYILNECNATGYVTDKREGGLLVLCIGLVECVELGSRCNVSLKPLYSSFKLFCLLLESFDKPHNALTEMDFERVLYVL